MTDFQLSTYKPAADLIDRMRARFAVVAIQSFEEVRVQRQIAEALTALNQVVAKGGRVKPRELWTWTTTDGLRPLMTAAKADTSGTYTFPTGGTLTSKDLADSGDLAVALTLIREWRKRTGAVDKAAKAMPFRHNETATVFLLKGAWDILADDNGWRNSFTARLVKDIALEFSQVGSNTVVMLDSLAPVPASVRKDITVVDWPLPGPDEMGALIERVEAERTAAGEAVALNGARVELRRALASLTEAEAEAVLSMAVIQNGGLNAGVVPLVVQEKTRLLKSTSKLTLRPNRGGWEIVGGLDKAVAYLKVDRAVFDRHEVAGRDARGAVMLVGQPGTGKTLLADAFGGHAYQIFQMDVGALKEGGRVGDAETNMRLALQQVRAAAPCVLILDEAEKFFGHVGEFTGDSGTTSGMFAQYLSFQADGVEPVYTIATVNNPTNLPPEFLSRFDKIFAVEAPDLAARRQIFAIELRQRGLDPQAFDLDALAEATPGFVGREVMYVVKRARKLAIARDGAITDAVLTEAVTYVRPLVQTAPDEVAKYVRWGRQYGEPAQSETAIGDEVDLDTTPVAGEFSKRTLEV